MRTSLNFFKFLPALGICVVMMLCFASFYETNANVPIVWDKEAIDCGTWYGTKCVNNGEGCDPKSCKEKEFGILI